MPSKLPMYSVPPATAGEAVTRPWVANFQRSVPVCSSSAYTLWSLLPKNIVPPLTAGLETMAPPALNFHLTPCRTGTPGPS